MLLSELASKFNISCFEPSDYKWLMDQYYINTSTHCDLHLSLFSCYLSFFGATVNTFVFLFTTNCYILRVYAFCACDWSDTHKTSSKPTYFFLLITSASTWANSVALKMEAAHSSEASVTIYETKRHNTLDDLDLHQHHCWEPQILQHRAHLKLEDNGLQMLHHHFFHFTLSSVLYHGFFTKWKPPQKPDNPREQKPSPCTHTTVGSSKI